LRRMGTEDHYLAMLRKIRRLEETALLDVQLPHPAVGKLHGLGRDVHHLRTVFEAEAFIRLRAHGGEKGNCITYRLNISIAELDLLSRPLATRLHARLAAPHHDDV